MIFSVLISNFFNLIYPYRHDVMYRNLSLSFPSLKRGDIDVLIRDIYKHFTLIFFDLLRFPFLNRRKLNKILTITPQAQDIISQFDRGIMLTAHFGNWEIIPNVLVLFGKKISAIALKQKNEGVNRFIMWARQTMGCKIIYKKGSTRKMLASLKSGFLVLAGDQFSSRRSIPVNFFGKETRSSRGAAVFHLKTGVPIFFTLAYLNDDQRYAFHMEKLEFKFDPSDSTDDKIQIINQSYHDKLEAWVSKYPEQYLWFHRKWRE